MALRHSSCMFVSRAQGFIPANIPVSLEMALEGGKFEYFKITPANTVQYFVHHLTV